MIGIKKNSDITECQIKTILFMVAVFIIVFACHKVVFAEVIDKEFRFDLSQCIQRQDIVENRVYDSVSSCTINPGDTLNWTFIVDNGLSKTVEISGATRNILEGSSDDYEGEWTEWPMENVEADVGDYDIAPGESHTYKGWLKKGSEGYVHIEFLFHETEDEGSVYFLSFYVSIQNDDPSDNNDSKNNNPEEGDNSPNDGNSNPGDNKPGNDNKPKDNDTPDNSGNTETPSVTSGLQPMDIQYNGSADVRAVMLEYFTKNNPDAVVKKMKFKSSNKKVVKVNKKGMTKGGKQAGTATITMYVKTEETIIKPNGKQKKKLSKWTSACTLDVNNTGKQGK